MRANRAPLGEGRFGRLCEVLLVLFFFFMSGGLTSLTLCEAAWGEWFTAHEPPVGTGGRFTTCVFSTGSDGRTVREVCVHA